MNFADIVKRLEAMSAGAPKTSEPKALLVRRLTVSGASLDYREETEAEPFATTVGPVSFSVREFNTGGKNQAPGEFAAVTESGETIGWKGTVAVAPLRSAGEFSLGSIVLKKYKPYVGRYAKFAITDGLLAVSGRYELVLAQDKPAVRLSEGVVSLKNFKLGAPGAAEPAVALESLELTGLSADSAVNSASVAKVALNGGRVVVTRDADGIDLMRLATPKAGALPVGGGAAGSGEEGTSLLNAVLGELAVAGLAVVVNDTTTPRAARQELTEVTLNVKDVSLAQLAKSSPVEFSAKIAGGGSVAVSGAVAPQPLKGDLTVTVDKVPLASVSPYAEMFVKARIARGSVSAKARVAVAAGVGGGLPAITAQADAGVEDFQVMEGEGDEELAHWKALSLRGIEAATSPSLKLLVADIEWTEPVGRVVVGENGAINLLDLMVTPAGAGQVKAAAAQSPAVTFNKAKTGGAPVAAAAEQSTTFIAIDRFTLNNAAFTFADRSMEPDVKIALNQLSGTVSGLSSATLARADVDLKGKVDGVAPVSIRGQINPLAAEAFTDLKVDFRGIDLQPTGPYVGKFAGYELAKGALTLDVRAKLSQRRLDTSNVVTLDQFTLGAKTDSPEATKLPVGLALALLRDRQGKIVLDVPVQGSMDDPEFRVGRVVWRVLGNILTKAATSPFALLGSMFGGGAKSEELAFQEFVAGSAELTDDSRRKLDVIAKALTERPALRLDIAGAFGAAADAPMLREQALEKGMRVALWEEQRRIAGPGAVVPPPEQITLSPEATARLTGVFYRAAFEPRELSGSEAGPGAKSAEAESSDEAEEKKRIWTPVVRMFRRGGAPAPVGSTKVATPKAPPPRAMTTDPTGAATVGAQAEAVPAGPTTEEMRAKLLAAITVDENTLRELAGERARRVRSYLIDDGHIDAERISLTGETAKGARVDLQLK
ncbi:hypothetical protein CMV30_09755 [Nibricoccus aquaticus]|uniref:DUF748 domain-containing protein n=1 Tax=Nibricoccus aquaticus TaxID=2576891 RepID=A0A290QFV5_9BACT|nr:hypothetical protein CMV30_09755 [Nibricoccus aquaticus]